MRFEYESDTDRRLHMGSGGVDKKVQTTADATAAVSVWLQNGTATTMGDEAHAVAMGQNSKAQTHGTMAHAVNTGSIARAIAMGDEAHAIAVGKSYPSAQAKDGVAVALGLGATAISKEVAVAGNLRNNGSAYRSDPRAMCGPDGVIVFIYRDEHGRACARVVSPKEDGIQPYRTYAISPKGKIYKA